MITAVPVESRDDRRDFLDVPARIHADAGTAGRYVPLLRSDVREWLTGRGWFTEPVTCLLARDETGRAVGRAITHHSGALDARLAESRDRPVGAQLFGALETESTEATRALLAAAEDRGREAGRTHLFGPVSPLPNVTGGAITSGFESPGFFDTAWNPPFVADALAAHGLTPWGAAHTWEVDVAGIPRHLRRAPTPFELREAGVEFVRPRRRPGCLARTLLPTLNASFAQLPYYTRIGEAQMRAQTAGAEFLMDPSLVVLARHGGRLASFALVLPDPVDVIRRHEGRLGAGAAWDLLRQKPRDAVLIVQGTDPEFQGRGLLSLCIRQLYAALHAGGYERLRVTFIAEDNPASAAVFERAGGRRLHGLSFFMKELA